MKKLIGVVGLVSLILVYSCGLALATSILYDDGPADYSRAGDQISNSLGAVESFTLGTDSVISGANIFVWTGYTTPLSVSWAITTAPFGGTIEASGASSISYTDLSSQAGLLSSVGKYGLTSTFEYGIASFSIPSVLLSNGTYYLQLSNAVSSPDIGAGLFVTWDTYNGPPGDLFYDIHTDSYRYVEFESAFQLLGTPVPEPGTLLLLGAGLAGLGLVRRRAKK